MIGIPLPVTHRMDDRQDRDQAVVDQVPVEAGIAVYHPVLLSPGMAQKVRRVLLHPFEGAAGMQRGELLLLHHRLVEAIGDFDVSKLLRVWHDGHQFEDQSLQFRLELDLLRLVLHVQIGQVRGLDPTPQLRDPGHGSCQAGRPLTPAAAGAIQFAGRRPRHTHMWLAVLQIMMLMLADQLVINSGPRLSHSGSRMTESFSGSGGAAGEMLM